MFVAQLFDHCLAPDTMGDGTGCDNMTCVIVTFQPSAGAAGASGLSAPKRPASPIDLEEASAKRTKTEDPETVPKKAPETDPKTALENASVTAPEPALV